MTVSLKLHTWKVEEPEFDSWQTGCSITIVTTRQEYKGTSMLSNDRGLKVQGCFLFVYEK